MLINYLVTNDILIFTIFIFLIFFKLNFMIFYVDVLIPLILINNNDNTITNLVKTPVKNYLYVFTYHY